MAVAWRQCWCTITIEANQEKTLHIVKKKFKLRQLSVAGDVFRVYYFNQVFRTLGVRCFRLDFSFFSCTCFLIIFSTVTVLATSAFRASSYEPGNRDGPVGGTNFVFCSYGKLNPGYRDEKCPKGPQNTRGIAFRLLSDLTSHAQLKMFRHGLSRYPGWSVHTRKIPSSVTEISVAKTEILVTAPASLLM